MTEYEKGLHEMMQRQRDEGRRQMERFQDQQFQQNLLNQNHKFQIEQNKNLLSQFKTLNETLCKQVEEAQSKANSAKSQSRISLIVSIASTVGTLISATVAIIALLT